MNATLFDTFNGRLRMEGLLTTRTGLHIGAGGSGDPLATDLPVVRDGSGRPYIPGSSLKGVLRSAAEALLHGAPFAGKPGEAALWACQMMSGAPCITHDQVVELRDKKENEPGRETVDAGREVAEAVWNASCTVCRLFGSLAMASRVRFPDLPLVGDLPGMELRNGVGIDRDKGLAADKVLYDFEAVPPGTSFRLTVILDNPEDSDAGLLLYLFHEMNEGNLALGGKTSRGLGQVRIAWESLVETSLRHGNPFADLLSSRDLLKVAAPAEPAEETTPAVPTALVLPTTGDPALWKALADLLLELEEINNSVLGDKGRERGLIKEELNEKLGLGLEGKGARKAWDHALGRLRDCGFLIKKGEEWVVASRATAEEKVRPAEEPARTGAIQDVIDRFVGALARRWQEAC
jgi:CRISPR-associated protein Csm3